MLSTKKLSVQTEKMIRSHSSVARHLHRADDPNAPLCLSKDIVYVKALGVLKAFDPNGTIVGLAPFESDRRWAISVSVSPEVVLSTSIEKAVVGIIDLEDQINRCLHACKVSLIVLPDASM